jgi:radical SAM superfamily enzyme YgiQ (UPF0313 family)
MYEPEAQGLTYDDLGSIIERERPDVVGLTCSTPNFPRAVRIAEMVKARSGALVVLGGVHASALPEFIVRRYAHAIDVVVVGEGEETMLDLLDAYSGGRSLEGIRGICYLNDGVPVRTEPRPYIEDLDRIPFPARDLIPQDLFVPNAHNARHRRCATILTSRGCPYGCTFCAARIVSGTGYRTHSPGYVLEEMRMLKREYGVRQLLITDDTFTLNRKRAEAICAGMIEGRMNLDWFCFSQVGAVDESSLGLMRRAGCYNIGFGVESADPGILKRMGKNILPEQALKAVHTANRLGYKTQAFYVLGSPGESLDQMRRTVEFAMEVDATLSFFNMLVPYPGTRDFEHFFGSVPLDEIHWDEFVAVGERCVLEGNPEVSPREVERLIAQANTRYYLRPRKVLEILSRIRTPYELFSYISGGVSFVRQILRWGSGK